jgi:hypothetical protein
MARHLTLALALAVAGLAGCNGNSQTSDSAIPPKNAKAADAGKADAAKSAAPTAIAHYEEIERDKIIYVVGTKASADKVKAGGKLAPYVSALGFGPTGTKVYFESDKDGLENKLMAEYDRRHPKK